MLIKDSDSINLQIKQLEVLNINQQIKNIIILSRNHNYYKAIKSIDAYPNNLYSNEYYNKINEEEEELIEQFDLFEDNGKTHERIVIDKPSVEKIEDEKEILEEIKEEDQKSQEEAVKEEETKIIEEPKEAQIVANTWFVQEPEAEIVQEEEIEEDEQIDEQKIEEQNETEEESEATPLEDETKNQDDIEEKEEIEHNQNENEDDNSWYAARQAEAGDIDPDGYNKDYMFHNTKEIENNTYYRENFVIEDELDDIAKDYYRQKMEEEKNGVVEKEEILKTKEIRKEISKEKEEGKLYIYEPTEQLEEKYQALIQKFSSLEQSDIYSIKHIINTFSNKAYSDDDIVGALEQFNEFKANQDIEEAIKIILLIASTDSPLAQFSFARELFKGDLLEQNYSEAFTLMNKLAIKNYPDAVCDLGQFYEYGVGTKKDRKRALILYQEAIDLGLNRASELYQKLDKSKQGIFSYLFD
jgi:TPR repeat protein